MFTNITNPVEPAGGAYAALDFDAGGVLYGLNSGAGDPPPTHLVTFDPATGVITDLGVSVNSLDAIAFRPVPEPGAVLLVLGPVVAGLLYRARSQEVGGDDRTATVGMTRGQRRDRVSGRGAIPAAVCSAAWPTSPTC